MLNRAQLLGHVGAAPEIKSMPNGDRVANFSLATSERWTDKRTGEKKEKTEWHRVVVWGDLVKIVEQYVHKGSKLFVEGKIQTRKWQDKNNEDRYSTEIVLSGFGAMIRLLDSKDDRGGHHEGAPPSEPRQADGYAERPAALGGRDSQAPLDLPPGSSKKTYDRPLDDEIPF